MASLPPPLVHRLTAENVNYVLREVQFLRKYAECPSCHGPLRDPRRSSVCPHTVCGCCAARRRDTCPVGGCNIPTRPADLATPDHFVACLVDRIAALDRIATGGNEFCALEYVPESCVAAEEGDEDWFDEEPTAGRAGEGEDMVVDTQAEVETLPPPSARPEVTQGGSSALEVVDDVVEVAEDEVVEVAEDDVTVVVEEAVDGVCGVETSVVERLGSGSAQLWRERETVDVTGEAFGATMEAAGASVEYVVASVEGAGASGETVVAVGEAADRSGEAASGEGAVANGEGVVSSGEGVVASGEATGAKEDADGASGDANGAIREAAGPGAEPASQSEEASKLSHQACTLGDTQANEITQPPPSALFAGEDVDDVAIAESESQLSGVAAILSLEKGSPLDVGVAGNGSVASPSSSIVLRERIDKLRACDAALAARGGRTIVCTSMVPANVRQKCVDICRSFALEYVRSFSEDCRPSIVVTLLDEERKVSQPSFNTLNAMLAGLPIVDVEWLMACDMAGVLFPLDRFLSTSRCATTDGTLFSGLCASLDAMSNEESARQTAILIRLGGGRVLPRAEFEALRPEDARVRVRVQEETPDTQSSYAGSNSSSDLSGVCLNVDFIFFSSCIEHGQCPPPREAIFETLRD